MAATFVHDSAQGVELSVYVKPRASKSRVIGERAGALDVAVAAPPVDGEANAELVRTLARHFDLPESRVLVVSGDAARRKRVRLVGMSLADARAKLGPAH